MRRAGKIDANQIACTKALRDAGMTVVITSGLGKGFPDAVVGFRGVNVLLEIKSLKAITHRGQKELTGDEERFIATWGGQVAIVETAEEAVLAVINHVKECGSL